jgi:hypothetical protein
MLAANKLRCSMRLGEPSTREYAAQTKRGTQTADCPENIRSPRLFPVRGLGSLIAVSARTSENRRIGIIRAQEGGGVGVTPLLPPGERLFAL